MGNTGLVSFWGNMKIYLITEGGSDIGIGHITRCLSLYQAFEEKGIKPIFIINGDESVKDLLNDKNYEIFNWLEQKKKLFGFIKNADITIVDSYIADYELYEKISKFVKVPVYIDDTKRIGYPKGIIINGTIYAEDFNYPPKKDTMYLLGSQYIPIRKEFWDVPDKAIRENIKTVMVTFGGDDARNMTPSILKLLNETFPELNKKVIIGKGFKNTEQIEALKDEKTEFIYYPDAEGIKKAMLDSDITISASGQTLYELARVGVPTIAISVADNQMNNIKGWQKAGFIEYAGAWDNKDILSVLMQKFKLLQIADIRKKMARAGRSWVDGLGAIRTVKFCLTKYFEDYISLRKAEKKDIYTIYELSNETEVRKNSFNPDKIDFETHKNWLTNKLENKTCLFLVAEIHDKFIGQVRFDISGDEAIISISLVKEYRGLGIGRILIQKAIDFLRLEKPNILFVKSYIKEGNIQSVRLFETTGFQFVNATIVNEQNAIEYLYSFHKG